MFYLLGSSELATTDRLQVAEVRRSPSGFPDLKLSLKFVASMVQKLEERTIAICDIAKPDSL